jgi:hypothetical protein
VTALGLLLALGSALALNWGFFVQHGAAGGLPPLSVRRPLYSLRLLFAHRRWLAGFLVGLGGWALYIGALRFAPLSLVQSVAAGGLGVLALLVWLSPGAARPGRREQAAVAVSVLGLLLLAVSLAGQGHNAATPGAGHVAAWLIGLGIAAVATVASTRLGLPAAVALGAAAGIFYATGDIATKAAVASLGLLFVPVVLASHGLAFVSLQLAFQRGGALVTVGLATLLTNALPIAAGAELFHEGIPPGPLGVVRLAAFALVVAGAALLSSPAHDPGATTTVGLPAGRSSNERLPSPL